MKLIKILFQIAILFAFYYIGTWIQEAFSLFIPGSIIGMLLLFSLLLSNLVKLHWINEGIDILLKDMPLLFIPVTVGVLEYINFFIGKGIILLFIVLFSTAMVIVTSGFTAKLLLKGEQTDE